MKTKPYEQSAVFDDLRDPEFAAGYLEDTLREGSIEEFLIALRDVARANGGMTALSEFTNLGRESLYKSLSDSGNPRFLSLQKILQSFGMRFSITLNPKEKDAA